VEPQSFRNVLLRQLSPAEILRLELHQVALPVPREIEFPGSEISNLFFLEEGVASITTTFRDGSQVEVGLGGYESILGASVFLGTRRSLNRVYMQIGGWGYVSRTPVALQEFERHGEFQRLVLRYTQAQLIQSMQTAGCNARHNILQRLARWLLLCDDRMGGKQLPLAQDFIAEMLGNRRTSVSVEAGKFQKLGLISYVRGTMTILDRVGLERQSCECYQVVRDHLQHYADSVRGFGT
jgi:CRP-like cAMP-binding protein